MTKGEENWHKLPRLYARNFNDEGTTALASAVIERAVVDLKATEIKKLRHKMAIGLESATDEELKINRDCKAFFRGPQYDFYAQIAGIEVPGPSVMNTVLNEAKRIAKESTKGPTPTGK